MYFQVVQSGKNTFFGDSETPCKHRKIQTVIRLQRIAKQITDEIYHLIIISGLKRFIQWNIILIDQQDDTLTVMLLQQPGKCIQTVDQCSI